MLGIGRRRMQGFIGMEASFGVADDGNALAMGRETGLFPVFHNAFQLGQV